MTNFKPSKISLRHTAQHYIRNIYWILLPIKIFKFKIIIYLLKSSKSYIFKKKKKFFYLFEKVYACEDPAHLCYLYS